MPAIIRKTATKIVNGQVDRKNRSHLSDPGGYTITRKPAGKGYRHVVSPAQVRSFIELIPDWPTLSERLLSIELVHGHTDFFGYHASYRRIGGAIIALCAWPKELWAPYSLTFFSEHRPIFDALGVTYTRKLTQVICRFNVAQARAFTLLNVFMHEVGHHHDWQHRRGRGLPGKEDYAEKFANRHFSTMFPRYCERFGDFS